MRPNFTTRSTNVVRIVHFTGMLDRRSGHLGEEGECEQDEDAEYWDCETHCGVCRMPCGNSRFVKHKAKFDSSL